MFPGSCFVANVDVNANAVGVAPMTTVDGGLIVTAEFGEIAGSTVV